MARKKKPIKIITLDTETYKGLIGGLKRIAIYDGEEVTYGYTYNDIKVKLEEYAKNFQVEIYIHNLEFDARKIPQIFDKDVIEWDKSFVINNKLAVVSNKKWTFHDSFKILPMGLKKLSEDFDVSTGKLDLVEEVLKTYPGEYEIYTIDDELDENKTLVNFLDKCHVDDELFLKYLGYDVISLYEVLQKLIEVSGLELKDFVKKMSTASLSRHIFKNGYKGQVFKNPFNNKTDYEIMCQYNYQWDLEVEQFLRFAYCGGRVEVFKPYGENLFHYDYNSLYPYEMENGEYPVGKPYYTKNRNLARNTYNTWLENKRGIGFLYCKIFIPKQNIPPLPCKKDKLAFVCGEVYGVWNFEEIEYAVNECGCKILEYYECVFYKQTYPVFKRFINTMLEIKNEGTKTNNLALRTFGKLLMNVGYGYTGMRRDDKTSLKGIEDYEKYEDEVIWTNNEFGYIEIPTDIKAEYIQVAIACTVTSRARLELLKALKYCDERGTVYYCDTDSIVTDVELPKEWCDKVELGKLDLEGRPQKALFLRPKVYAEILSDEETNIKFKGLSKETQKQIDFSFYEMLLDEIIEGDKKDIVIEKNRLTFRSIMYMKKQGLEDDYFEERDKKMNLDTMEKRIMDYKNNTTSPYFFKSEKEFEDFSFSKKQSQVEFSIYS